jgi:hypothetical protein
VNIFRNGQAESNSGVITIASGASCPSALPILFGQPAFHLPKLVGILNCRQMPNAKLVPKPPAKLNEFVNN